MVNTDCSLGSLESCLIRLDAWGGEGGSAAPGVVVSGGSGGSRYSDTSNGGATLCEDPEMVDDTEGMLTGAVGYGWASKLCEYRRAGRESATMGAGIGTTSA